MMMMMIGFEILFPKNIKQIYLYSNKSYIMDVRMSRKANCSSVGGHAL